MESPDAKTLRDLDRAHHIHPFTTHEELHAMGTQIIKAAEGVYLTDIEGRRLLDGLAGLWCTNVGYGRREIADAIHAQVMGLSFYSSFFNNTTEPAIRLAARLAQLAPKRLQHVFFANSGSEANESALKIIRAYNKLRGRPQKNKILTRTYAYHGVTVATTSMTGLPGCYTPFDLPLPGFLHAPGPYSYVSTLGLSPEAFGQHCIEETEKLILKEGADTIAACFAEPIQGAGGVIVPPPGYLKALRALCKKHDILFVADEVITGFGRLGDWFASNLWDLDPDLMILAKGITSGYVPLGATMICDEIANVIIPGGYFAHGFTYSGHPVACAAALVNIDIIQREKLIQRVRDDVGPYFQEKLAALRGHQAVGETRGHGLIGAIELLPRGGREALAKATSPMNLGVKGAKLVRQNGVVVRGIRDLLAIAPPLTITRAQIDELFAGVTKGLDALWD